MFSIKGISNEVYFQRAQRAAAAFSTGHNQGHIGVFVVEKDHHSNNRPFQQGYFNQGHIFQQGHPYQRGYRAYRGYNNQRPYRHRHYHPTEPFYMQTIRRNHL